MIHSSLSSFLNSSFRKQFSCFPPPPLIDVLLGLTKERKKEEYSYRFVKNYLRFINDFEQLSLKTILFSSLMTFWEVLMSGLSFVSIVIRVDDASQDD
ncbi:hypothetical protein CEXT_392801 [Caerostris extrusa]|uniref:Uncharacterized protein n=1 Tax=Caerostris extrusa TaxID=172846 RepID=A0AAV4MS15_CAEEX|nr:hypothetical protein CEXT_392801 [Caerostris extrusa]